MSGIKIIAKNRKARFDYEILEDFEAGMSLLGTEVKSIRAGEIRLKDSYIIIKNGEAFLQNAHIKEYSHGTHANHAPERLRKLLLNKNELIEIESALSEKGLSCVPLSIYFKNGRIKLKIALAKGKKFHDKRQDIKKRDASREIQRVLRHNK